VVVCQKGRQCQLSLKGGGRCTDTVIEHVRTDHRYFIDDQKSNIAEEGSQKTECNGKQTGTANDLEVQTSIPSASKSLVPAAKSEHCGSPPRHKEPANDLEVQTSNPPASNALTRHIQPPSANDLEVDPGIRAASAAPLQRALPHPLVLQPNSVVTIIDRSTHPIKRTIPLQTFDPPFLFIFFFFKF
jgi:hypothetical protein